MRWLWLVSLAACGRIGFDSTSDSRAVPLDIVPFDGPLPSGLVGWYPMDDQPANTADVIGGVNGTCGTVQDCPLPTAGHHGGAFLFDAARTCIEIPDAGQFALPTYTLAIWGRVTQLDACSAFAKRVDVGGSTLDSWQIYTTSTGQVELMMNNGAASGSKITTPDGALTAGVWHHFAATVDGSTRILYLDGVNVMSSPWTTTNYDSHSVWVGCDDQGGGTWSIHWRGELDDFQIYNRALSASEIQMLASQ